MKYFFLLFFFVSLNSFSQSISGLVIDGEFSEPLPFANVLVKGTTKGTTTDIDGKYQIKIDPGTYTLSFSFVGYSTVEISEVIVQDNKNTFLEVTLKPSENQLEAVVVKTSLKKNSEASVLSLQKKSASLIDGLSVQAIRKAGDSDVAGAIKRVPGISVQGGKYVYVRGLGDRYSKTTLNGMELPGLDPDRNTIPMDIFPTNLIDNIIVKKSASSNVGADFTGGTVDINLKDFSFSPQYNVSFSTSYNPDMHFNSDFLRDGVRSGTDWIGVDDGVRDLPIDPSLNLQPADIQPLLSPEEAAVLTENTRKLNPIMGPIQQTSDMNYSFGFSASNGYDLDEEGNSKIGYIAAVGYKSQTTYFSNFIINTAEVKPGTAGSDAIIENLEEQTSELGTINNFLSSLVGVSFKTNKHKLRLNFLNLQNGESNASNLNRENFEENAFVGVGTNVTYTQRNLMTIPLSGAHTIGDNALKINWSVAKSKSKVNDKDWKRAVFEVDQDETLKIRPNVTSSPSRIWRDLEEDSFVAKLDFEFNIKTNFLTGKFNIGGSYINKERDFNGKKFDIFYLGRSEVFGGDPNLILAEENIWVQSPNLFESTDGSYIQGGFERTNVYNSILDNSATYVSTELKFSDSFRAIVGLRYENYGLKYTGEDLLGTQFEEEQFIDKSDFFTNLNLVYSPTENSNIRFAFYQTTARPTFREASAAVIPDPINEINFLGNPNIQPAYIDNFDLRYEYFGEKSEMIALSVFNKSFKNPIEIANISIDQLRDFTPINNETANVFGVELELRKNLLTADTFTLNLNTNATFIDAKQRMNDVEFESRVLLSPNIEIDRNRELQGQSPFMINAGITANDSEKAIQAGFYYNVQGATLQFVGLGGAPDVFIEPFHNLDFSASKEFKNDKTTKKLTFRVRNILQDSRESFYVWNGEKTGIFSQRNPGITFSLGASITF